MSLDLQDSLVINDALTTTNFSGRTHNSALSPDRILQNRTELLGHSSMSSLDQAVSLAKDYLKAFATSANFTTVMRVAFGSGFDINQASNFATNWAHQDFSQIPEINVVPEIDITGANGAFAIETNIIYLSNRYLNQQKTNVDAITGVVLEEIGHFIDSHLNSTDSPGDEGDIFSRLVRGQSISNDDLLALKTENDHGLTVLDGQSVSIEMSQIAIESLNRRLYQSHRSTDNNVYTRSSIDGVNWTGWQPSGGQTYSAPALATLNGRLYQSIRGTDNNIYTHSSTDGVNWTSWQQLGGQTPNAPTLAALNGRLYQSVRGMDNNIYTRSSTDGVSWTGWLQTGGQTADGPTLAALNGRLYQSVRGTDNNIYTRSSTDGVSWTGWLQFGGQTYSAASLEAVSGRLYQSHRGTDNNIYTRSSTDGLNWTGWLQTGGQTPDAPSLAALNGRLYQSHQGLDNKIYTRSSTDGLNWTGWSEAGGMTLTDRATNWKAEFFNGISIDPVNPGLVQDWGIGDNDLSKNWGIGSPGIGISTDNFSARFTTTRYFAPGLWKVESQADDGLRVRVGNQDVISRWVDQGYAFNSGYFYSSGGNYPVMVNYYERGGAAALDVKFKKAQPFQEAPGTGWSSEVFAVEPWNSSTQVPSTNFADDRARYIGSIGLAERTDGKAGVYFDAREGALKGYNQQLPHDNFAVRGYKESYFDGGEYKFRVEGDDAFQLFAKGTRGSLAGKWFDLVPGGTPMSTWAPAKWETANGNAKYYTVKLPAGWYDVHFSFAEAGGNARFDLSWEKNLVNSTINNPAPTNNPAPLGLISTPSKLAELTSGNLVGQSIDVDKFPVGNIYQCVDLVKYATGNMSQTKYWKPGANVMASGNVAIGTAIATFLGPNNSFITPNDANQHTGIFAGYGTQNGVSGFWLWDQWAGVTIQKRFYGNNRSGKLDADNYYVIRV